MLLRLLLLVYVLPNIKYLGVGENSILPLLIIVLCIRRRHFRNFGPLFILLTVLGFLGLFFPSYKSGATSILAPLATSYIFIVPLFSSVLLGETIGLYLASLSSFKAVKWLSRSLLMVSFLFFFSYLLNKTYPEILTLFLHAGRTSFDRSSFFFPEPSSGSPLIITMTYLSILGIFSSSENLNPKIYSLSLYLAFVSLFVILLSLPVTFFATLIVAAIALIASAILITLPELLCTAKLRFSISFRQKSGSITVLAILMVVIILSMLFYEKLLPILSFGKLSQVFWQVTGGHYGSFFFGFLIAGGFRFYYAITSVILGFEKIFSFPGHWFGNFPVDVVSALTRYNLLPTNVIIDSFLQLDRDPILIKPTGWLYFIFYDYGVLGFILLLSLLILGLRNLYAPYFRDYSKPYLLFIGLSFQVANLIIPGLPATPSVFGPLLIAIALVSYSSRSKFSSSLRQ